MKISTSAEGPDLSAQVGHRFGISPCLIIVDTQTMAFEAVFNPAAGRQGGAGVTAVALSISKQVDVVLTGYCSPTATRYLSENGIEVLTGISATATGIFSMEPIFAWYPLVKDLRKKGAAYYLIAIFLGNRSVKPFLLPIMISYFGWTYVLLLTFFTIAGSVVAGFLVGIFLKEHTDLIKL
jgi:predicted Fe-Mo cluster-binding NifX family protein